MLCLELHSHDVVFLATDGSVIDGTILPPSQRFDYI